MVRRCQGFELPACCEEAPFPLPGGEVGVVVVVSDDELPELELSDWPVARPLGVGFGFVVVVVVVAVVVFVLFVELDDPWLAEGLVPDECVPDE